MNKYLFNFVVIVLLLVGITSCQKIEEDFEPGMVRNDDPPKEMFANAAQYCEFSSVFIEKEDLDKSVFYGNYQAGVYFYTDDNGNRTESRFYQDYYKITCKKFFGLYLSRTYISLSSDYYLVSGSDLAYIKELIIRKGSVQANLDVSAISSQWKTISGVR